MQQPTTQRADAGQGDAFLCHFVHGWLDFRAAELQAAAEAQGVALTASDADVATLSEGAGGVFLPVRCAEGAAGIARVAQRTVLVKRFVDVWASGATFAELEERLRAYPAASSAPYLAAGSTFKLLVEGFGHGLSDSERLGLINAVGRCLSSHGRCSHSYPPPPPPQPPATPLPTPDPS